MNKINHVKKKLLIVGVLIFGLFTVLGLGAQEASLIQKHSITIQLFPESHSFKAEDHLSILSEGETIKLSLNRAFEILSVKVGGKPVEFQFTAIPSPSGHIKPDADRESTDKPKANSLVFSVQKPGKQDVVITYKGVLYDKPSTSQFSREYVANQSTGVISEEGTFLSPDGLWYVGGDEKMTRFSVYTITPIGYESVTQGERISHEIKQDDLHVQWRNVHPADSLILQAGPYTIGEDEVDGVKIFTYFFKGGESLSNLYLRKSKQYIGMYNKLLGPYPYKKFAVVENFFETGYGMPSWTLLGKTVVRLPFIPDTSLPHEICHNWWGNGVFIDYSFGNWCEGLTVYCADYLLKKKQPGGDADYRRQTNRDYSSYVKDKNDFPLTEFRSRHNPATRAVGYGKAMMVFHDLQRKVGEEPFFRSLRRFMSDFRFQSAHWKDLLGVFESDHGLDLSGFFPQWIERSGAPELRLVDARSRAEDSGYGVSFRIKQESEPYVMNIPVLITTESGSVTENISLKDAVGSYEFQVDSKPVRVEIDPGHHLFRRLFPEEIPPSIAKVFGAEKQIILLGDEENAEKLELYKEAAQMINRTKTAVIKLSKEVTAHDLTNVSVIILGELREKSKAAEWLRPLEKPMPWEKALGEEKTAGSVLVYNHPGSRELAVMVIQGKGQSDILSIARKLPHYGKYSYLLFHGGKNVAKGIWEIESSPLIHVF